MRNLIMSLFWLLSFAGFGQSTVEKPLSDIGLYDKLVYVWQTVDGDTYYCTNYIKTTDSTIAALPYQYRYKVRLYGVDTPEGRNPYVSKEQPYAREAAAQVRGLMTGNRVTLDSMGIDQYGRIVARVQLPDGRDLSKVIAAEGWGWEFPQNLRRSSDATKAYADELEALRKAAKRNKIGLFGLRSRALRPSFWRDKNPGAGSTM